MEAFQENMKYKQTCVSSGKGMFKGEQNPFFFFKVYSKIRYSKEIKALQMPVHCDWKIIMHAIYKRAPYGGTTSLKENC